MSNLQRAIEIAVVAHRDQTRKDGSPYVLHPLRLMFRVDSNEEKIVAVLHDVVEDTEVTLEQLHAAGFGEDVLAALRLVTHDSGDSYENYIGEIKKNSIARAVKLADLQDNSNVFEMPNLTPKDLARVQKYHKAYLFLRDELVSG